MFRVCLSGARGASMDGGEFKFEVGRTLRLLSGILDEIL